MKQIKINKTDTLDLEVLIDSKLLIQANSGGGKSWALRRLLEQSHGKVQQIILDPEGEFGSLREKYDYILAGKDGDVPADPKSAALLARKLLELNVSAIIDLYELHPQDRKRFVRLFLEAMINAPKTLYHPCLVVIDEAHIFAPEKGQSEAMDAVIGLCSLGRKRGYCAVLATQRISKLHKDAAAECNNKFIGRTGLDIDRKRASEELGFTSKEQVLSLRNLEPGEFYAYGPAISREVVKVKIGEVNTSHPKAGARISTKTVPPTEKIKKVLQVLTDLPKEAEKEAKTADELKAQNRSLLIENQQLKKHPLVSIDTQAIEKAVQQKQKEVDAWINYARALSERLDEINHLSDPDELSEPNFEPKKELTLIQKATQKFMDKKVVDFVTHPLPVSDKKIISFSKEAIRKAYPDFEVHADGVTFSSLSGPEQRILKALATLYSIGITEPETTAVAFVAGYTAGGGAFNNPRGSLRSKGLLTSSGSKTMLTEGGLGLSRHTMDTHFSSKDLMDKIMRLLPGPERKLFECIYMSHSQGVSPEELAGQTGYTLGGGAFNNPKGRLRTLGLIEYRGGRIYPKDFLFF